MVQLIRNKFSFFFRKKKKAIEENILFDFSLFNDIVGKDNFIKNTILKQVELSKLLCVAYPNVDFSKQHTNLMESIAKSNMHVILAEKLNGAVTIEQFAHVCYVVLSKNIDNLLSN